MSKTVLIAGATSDIAMAIAKKYASNAWNLQLVARKVERLDSFARDLELQYEVEVSLHELDFLDYEAQIKLFLELDTKPDGIIVAIGYLGNQEKAEKDNKEADLIMRTNYNACVNFINIGSRELIERKNGFIIGISSVAGERGRQSNYFYGSAKAGFTEYLSGLRNSLSKNGIHVLTVKPGFVKTKMTEGLDLPEKLTASPEQVAKDVFKAQQKAKNTIYTLWFWRYIMLIIKLIPEPIFKKLNL